MVTGIFKELFNRKANGYEIRPFSRGEKFPLEVDQCYSDYELVIFLSLSCSACIDFIPEIDEIARNDAFHISLLISGTVKDVAVLKEQLKFECYVTSITEKEKIDKYRVPAAPYVYLLDKDKSIVTSGEADCVEEVKELLSGIGIICVD
ncbi:hypothetical protein [Paenibacillus puerhi]|uniref:hypothetical protein n=1 Tax=Paenibacillus puerhi TaxID=2692622 RepID=UPI001356E0FB|nr:hypothetical protein [Paenibacillus puerhi]